MPGPYPELEIGLHRVQADAFQVELRFSDPASDAERSPVRAPCALDPEVLLPLQLEPEAYGRTLAGQVFSEPEAGRFLGEVKTSAQQAEQPLRLRLLIGPSATDLEALRWELLCDPDTGAPFATSERVLFSRFMPSQDWRPVRLRPKADLRALVAVAAPGDIAQAYQLAEVDLPAEVTRATGALEGIATEVLGQDRSVTLDGLIDALRSGVDILYLVAHGALDRKRGPSLFLQDEAGRTRRVSGDDLARRVGELRELPRLVVLASCESAATPASWPETVSMAGQPTGPTVHASPQSALAPRLAAAGVPAVMAMQGRIGMETVATLMPRFFQELVVDGQIDRALAVARGLVRDRADAWMPALFMRLRGGRLWYQPGFAGANAAVGADGVAADDARRWEGLINDITHKRFTPILGWGLAEGIFGSTGDLAQRLAQINGFPLAPHQRGDLPQVSDFLGVRQRADGFPLDALKAQLCQAILQRHRDLPDLEAHRERLSKLLKIVGEHHRQDPQDPYRLAAGLPAPVFIDATPGDLLVAALKDAGKTPVVRHAVWRPGEEPPEPYTEIPSVSRPLVYHILGRFKDRASVVLTQDDHFDYLIGASRNRALIPDEVRYALSSQTLLFLGFQLHDWSFRVLYRLIRSQEGKSQGRNLRLPHAAVQLDPEGTPLLDSAAARTYLTERYQGDNVSLYWGSGEDFLRDIAPRVPRRDPAEWDANDEDDDEY